METPEHAFVVGGGPAGLVAAIALRRKGLRVTVADGGDFPSDKACGEGILPEGLASLQRLGITLDLAEGRAFHGIRFANEHGSAEADFGSRSGLGMRRIVLHRQLIRAAEQVGVSILRNTPINGVSNGRVFAGADSLAADWIIGADGFHSQVRRWAKLGEKKPACLRYAFRRHFARRPWTDFVEVHWATKAQLYVTPVSNREIGVVVLSADPRLRLQEALQFFPAVRERLTNCEATTVERGAATGNLSLRAVCSGNIALVGDASGAVDAITGEGMSLAFQQAEALAEAIAKNDLSLYAAAHSRLRRRPIWMARLLLTLQGHPKLQERVLQIFAAEPELFQRMLAVHVGHVSPFSLATAGARLGLLLLAGNFF